MLATSEAEALKTMTANRITRVFIGLMGFGLLFFICRFLRLKPENVNKTSCAVLPTVPVSVHTNLIAHEQSQRPKSHIAKDVKRHTALYSNRHKRFSQREMVYLQNSLLLFEFLLENFLNASQHSRLSITAITNEWCALCCSSIGSGCCSSFHMHSH